MPSALNDFSQKIIDDLRQSGMSRGTLGGGIAFGWTEQLPPTIASYCATELVEGMSVPTVRVSESGTPATIVAEGAPKPTGTVIATGTTPLRKFAGLGTFTMEASLTASGVAAAVAAVLGSSALMAFEEHAMGVLETDAGETATGGTWTAALAAAQGVLLGNGGRPALTIVSAADYGTLLGEISAGAGFSQSPDSPVGAFYGSPLHVSPRLAAGSAFVLDTAAVVAFQHRESPLVVCDAVSQAEVNTARLVIDIVGAVAVANPQHVVAATKTP